jgi:hypothetical protein
MPTMRLTSLAVLNRFVGLLHVGDRRLITGERFVFFFEKRSGFCRHFIRIVKKGGL